MKGREVYIVAGGASLRGFPFHKLEDVDTIAVNMAAHDVPNPTYCITADSSTFRKVQEGYFKNIDTTWVLVTNPNHCTMQWHNGIFKNIKSKFVYNLFSVNMVIRNAGTDGIGFSFKDFKTGYNSGFCAFQLAVLLGYQKICLLGIDLNRNDGNHYSNRYRGARIKNETLDKFYNNFVIALEEVREKTDIEVISCSSISRLNKHIPYIPFEKVIRNEGYEEINKMKTEPLEITSTNNKNTLSILICSITKRRALLDSLLKSLKKQKTDRVEILVEIDNKKMPIGTKRNKLLEKAKGDYIVFIDDDDKVSDDYVSKILNAIKSNPDCCGMEGFLIRGKTKRKFIHSIKYKKWFEENRIYYRCPNHISPVKRKLALKVGFPEKSHGEDKVYSMGLLPLLKNEVYIEEPIYYYMAGE